jgi:putative spermidine/putrescine transport system permease protein
VTAVAVDEAREPGRRRGGPLLNRWALLIVPAIVFLAAFFVIPLLFMGIRSVTDPPGAGLSNYVTFFSSETNIRVLRNTFFIASLSTLICLLLGYPYAYLMNAASPRVGGLLLIVVLLPFWSSLLVRTFAWEVILRDSGVLNSLLIEWGLIDKPIQLMRNTLGVIIGMSQILLPFMVLPLWATMRRIDPELTRAAANLGASPSRAFRRVFLPLSLPGVVSGTLLVFVLALGFYITPALLGSPRETMISRFIADQIQTRLNWGLGSAMAVVLMVVTLGVLLVASRFVRLRDVYGALEES